MDKSKAYHTCDVTAHAFEDRNCHGNMVYQRIQDKDIYSLKLDFRVAAPLSHYL